MFTGDMNMTSNRPEYGSSLLLNKDEMPLFVEAALEMPRVRDQALCLLIFFTGCRPSEANQIKPDSLIPDRSMVELPTLKQRQKVNPTRRVHIPEFLMTMLLSLCNGDLRIFPLGRTRVYEIVKDCMNRAGLTGKKANSRGLRRSYVTGNILSKTPLPDIQKRAGHARIESTLRYVHLADEETRSYAENFWDFATTGAIPKE